MLNVHSSGKEPYLSASPGKPKSNLELVETVFLILADIVKVIGLSFIELIKVPINVFTFKPKVIKGQTALITGGGNGIGKAIALELAKRGCNIVIADVDKVSMENTLELLRKYDVKAVSFLTDVSNPQEVENLKKAIDESVGPVHILVNNAGLMPILPIGEGSSSDVKRIIDVNFNSNIWMVRTFLPDMIKHKNSHIVQMSSMAALHPVSCGVIYSATKCAVMGFMLALEEEMRQEGLGDCVDFTTVLPYFVSTRKDLMDRLNLRIPAVKPEVTAKEIVKGILFRKRRVVIPHFFYVFMNIFNFMPYTIQCYLRDYVFRETSVIVSIDQIKKLNT